MLVRHLLPVISSVSQGCRVNCLSCLSTCWCLVQCRKQMLLNGWWTKMRNQHLEDHIREMKMRWEKATQVQTCRPGWNMIKVYYKCHSPVIVQVACTHYKENISKMFASYWHAFLWLYQDIGHGHQQSYLGLVIAWQSVPASAAGWTITHSL